MNNQIEIMAKIIGENSWEGITRPECYVCAEALYNAGCRKVNEGDKVLTKEEYEEFIEASNWLEFRKGELIDEVKEETAREILQELLKKQRFMLTNDLFGGNAVLVQGIKEIAKEYGVEVE